MDELNKLRELIKIKENEIERLKKLLAEMDIKHEEAKM